MKAILLSLFVALLMVGCGESSQPSESVDMTDTAPKKDDIETPVDYVDYYKLKKRNGVTYLPNEETPFTGRAEDFYQNGRKELKVTYKDGKKEGLATKWYENGQKNYEVNYKDGKVVSAVVWKPNGEKCPETNVKDGNGVLVSYNNDGTVWLRSTYKDGD